MQFSEHVCVRAVALSDGKQIRLEVELNLVNERWDYGQDKQKDAAFFFYNHQCADLNLSTCFVRLLTCLSM